jgi:hypothetical protein
VLVSGRGHDVDMEPQPEEVLSQQATDGALVRAARLGDVQAFAVIVDRHGPAMYRYAVRLLHHDADAAEVVQEAFISAWKNLHTFQGRSNLRTWLFGSSPAVPPTCSAPDDRSRSATTCSPP